jgi:tRNA (guanine37-N1)-methyltransferase
VNVRIDVVTLFPEMFDGFCRLGIVGRALGAGAVTLGFQSPRDFGLGKHRSVDDTPYGGGAGMVMRVDVLVACLEAVDAAAGGRGHRILLTPQGSRLDQRKVHELAARPALVVVCGRYEGIDERARRFVDEEISVGDYVLSGGEVAAMALVDAVVRLHPGVLGNPESLREESHSPHTGGLLEYPQYTRPVEFRGERVPDVLQSGDHARIAAWRREQARERTRAMRPDLLPHDSPDEEPS